MEFAHLLGKEIKALREQAEMTQNELAVKIEKDTDYISKIERGKRIPSLTTLMRISKVLNSSLYDIFRHLGI